MKLIKFATIVLATISITAFAFDDKGPLTDYNSIGADFGFQQLTETELRTIGPNWEVGGAFTYGNGDDMLGYTFFRVGVNKRIDEYKGNDTDSAVVASGLGWVTENGKWAFGAFMSYASGSTLTAAEILNGDETQDNFDFGVFMKYAPTENYFFTFEALPEGDSGMYLIRLNRKF